MNKTYKIVKNRAGASQVAGELAKGIKKGMLLATVLFSSTSTWAECVYHDDNIQGGWVMACEGEVDYITMTNSHNNELTLNNATVASSVHGAYSNKDVINNTVILNGNTSVGNVLRSGYSTEGSAIGNSVIMNDNSHGKHQVTAGTGSITVTKNTVILNDNSGVDFGIQGGWGSTRIAIQCLLQIIW